MLNLNKLGLVGCNFFGISLFAFGMQQFIYGDFISG